MSTRASGRSVHTAWKDEHVPVLGQKVLCVARNAVRKWNRYDRVLYIDLTAGAGLEADGRPCLALRLLDWAHEQGIPVEAHLCERDAERYRTLAAEVDERYRGPRQPTVDLYRGDCHEQSARILSACGGRLLAARCGSADAYGLLLADPCGFVPWEALHAINRALPRLDVLLYMGAATPKWHGRSKNLPSIEEHLDALGKKQRALISAPRGNYQWVIILVSNFAYGRSEKHGLEYLDSERGRAWYERALWTREQRRALYQAPLEWPELRPAGDQQTQTQGEDGDGTASH